MVMMQEGRWAVGSRLSYADLARELKVSRPPVRRVLQFMARLGHIEELHPRGFRLLTLPTEDELSEALIPSSEGQALYDRIVRARARGEIPDDVSEAELVERFGAKRGAIRRALVQLSSEGLAERRAGHGWTFAEALDNEKAIKESYAFRAILECGAILDEDFEVNLGELHQLVEQQSAILNRPIAQLDGHEWFEANAHFHRTVVSWSQNRFMIRAIERQNILRRMAEHAEFTELSEAAVHRAAREHLAILEALKSDSRSLAAALLQHHLSRTRKEPLSEVQD